MTLRSLGPLVSLLLALSACQSTATPPWTSPFPPGFEPIYPPQTGWEVGSIVIKDGARVDYWGNTATTYGAPRVAPSQTFSSMDLGALSANAILPDILQAAIEGSGASDYTVKLTDCTVADLRIREYSSAFALELADGLESGLSGPLAAGQVRYVVSALGAKQLEYSFKAASGAQIKLAAAEIAEAVAEAGLDAKYSVTQSGTLMYKEAEPVWVAFKLRRIGGDGTLQAAGGLSVSGGRTTWANEDGQAFALSGVRALRSVGEY